MRARLPWIAAVAAVVLLAGGYAWWRDGGKRLFQPRNFAVVDEGWLYRSGQIHPRLIEDVLREHRIDVVIDLAQDDTRVRADRVEQEAVERLGIEKVDLFGLDGRGIGPVRLYTQALQRIVEARRQGQRVLVHCAAGSERTGATVALYRMLYQGWDGSDAYAEYLSFRNRPPEKPRLSRFVNRHMPKISDRLMSSGALEGAPSPFPVFGP